MKPSGTEQFCDVPFHLQTVSVKEDIKSESDHTTDRKAVERVGNMSYFANSDALSKWAEHLPNDWQSDWLKWSVTLSTKRPTEEEQESLPYISNEDIESWTGRLLKDDLKPAEAESRRFWKDDVLFNKLRPYLAKVLHTTFDGVSSGELLCLRPSQVVEPRFLFYVLVSKGFVDTINAETFGAKMPRANWEIVGHQPLPLPPLNTQQRIAQFLDEKTAQIDYIAARVEASVELLGEYRAALITAAVTGKIEALLSQEVTRLLRKQAPTAFKRAVFAAYIADSLCDQPTFGRVKFQKILHLSEVHLGIDEVDGNYYRDAAGPFDTRMMRSVHSQLKEQGWITTKKREGAKGTQYQRGAKINAYRTYFDRYFNDKKDAIDDFLTIMGPMNTQRTEIVSTSFAAWNDLLIEGKIPSDDNIVDLILNDWNESKRGIAPERWRAALVWMREKGIIPHGLGEHTKRKA